MPTGNWIYQSIRSVYLEALQLERERLLLICHRCGEALTSPIEVVLGADHGLLSICRPNEKEPKSTLANSAGAPIACPTDRCAAAELTGYSRTTAIERRGDPVT